MVEYLRPNLEIRRSVMEMLGKDLNICFQCGGCTGVCPWGEVRRFNPRIMLRKAQLGIGDVLSDDVWLCTTCAECVDHCPHQVEMPFVMSSIRSLSVEEAKIPSTLQDALESTFRLGNPWQGSVRDRTKWAKGLDVGYYEDQDILWWVGCTPAYDERNQEVARSLANILNSADVSYGTLGRDEKCCGNSARRMGEEGLYLELMEANLKLMEGSGAERIIATSPHCYNAFKNDYPDVGVEFLHYTQFLNEIKDELAFLEEFDHTVTYQDPCYLGRHNDLYDDPREVLQSIPGLDLKEMDRNRETSLCCGGGGGRIWAETDPEERFSNIRLEEALEVGADVIATACPFCMLNFEDSVKTMDLEEEIKIMDVAEIVWTAMSWGRS